LYVQMRAGRHGRPFRLLKLRTMRPDAESDGPAFATRDDPRVTAVGRFLRRLRLDELPQLVNVLRGDMSLVGPRPERPEFVAELARAIPYYTFRLAVPPGLTGWAQVHMPSAVTVDDHRRKLEYDLYFIRERSVALYLFTLLRTASAALVGTGR
jgi:lipopolysaccharide/colanic/teichoic acid biosynthesis glycosyltransferase